MRMLLLGGTGQIGEEFRSLPFPKDVEVVAPNRSELDLEDPQGCANYRGGRGTRSSMPPAIRTWIGLKPSRQGFAINAEAPSQLAAETGRHGIRSFIFRPTMC
jgi:dTDP-4-dehydrorhamnose reductase